MLNINSLNCSLNQAVPTITRFNRQKSAAIVFESKNQLIKLGDNSTNKYIRCFYKRHINLDLYIKQLIDSANKTSQKLDRLKKKTDKSDRTIEISKLNTELDLLNQAIEFFCNLKVKAEKREQN